MSVVDPVIWPIVGWAAALLTSFGFVPQVLKMWRRRSSADVSPATFGQFTAGVTLWTAYGFYLDDTILIAANLTTLATLVVGIVLYARFRPKPPTPAAAGTGPPPPSA